MPLTLLILKLTKPNLNFYENSLNNCMFSREHSKGLALKRSSKRGYEICIEEQGGHKIN